MAKNTKDLKFTTDNPRHVTQEKLGKLDDNYNKFGTLSGIIYNQRLDELVSGNQRTKRFNQYENQIEITEQYDKPQKDGTIAYGFIILKETGQREPYRIVDWDKKKHKEAVIVANTNAGDWDMENLYDNWDDVRDEWVSEVHFDTEGGVPDNRVFGGGEAIDGNDYNDNFSLKDGDRELFQSMTFTFADEQAILVKNMIQEIKQTDLYKYAETFGNENSNGNALYLIVKEWGRLRI